jgi:hypothetical protein
MSPWVAAAPPLCDEILKARVATLQARQDLVQFFPEKIVSFRRLSAQAWKVQMRRGESYVLRLEHELQDPQFEVFVSEISAWLAPNVNSLVRMLSRKETKATVARYRKLTGGKELLDIGNTGEMALRKFHIPESRTHRPDFLSDLKIYIETVRMRKRIRQSDFKHMTLDEAAESLKVGWKRAFGTEAFYSQANLISLDRKQLKELIESLTLGRIQPDDFNILSDAWVVRLTLGDFDFNGGNWVDSVTGPIGFDAADSEDALNELNLNVASDPLNLDDPKSFRFYFEHTSPELTGRLERLSADYLTTVAQRVGYDLSARQVEATLGRRDELLRKIKDAKEARSINRRER